jgi:hypothetical protein
VETDVPAHRPLFHHQSSSRPDELRQFEPLEDPGARPVFLAGVWVIFGGWIVYALAVAVDVWNDPSPHRLTWLEMLSSAVMAAFSAAVLWVCTRRYLRLRRSAGREVER